MVGSLLIIADWWFCKDGCGCVGPGCAKIAKYGQFPPEWSGHIFASEGEVVPALPADCAEIPDGKDCSWIGDVGICDGWCLCRFVHTHANPPSSYIVLCTDRHGNRVN